MTAEEFELKLRHYNRLALSSADADERARFRAMADKLMDELRSQLEGSKPQSTRQ